MRGRALRIVFVCSCAVALLSACSSDESSSRAGAGGTSGVGGASGASSGGGGSAGAGGGGGSAGASGASSGGGGSAGASGGSAGASGGSAGATGGSAGAIGDASPDSDPGDGPSLPLAGFGTITGDCGPIDPTELTSPNPFDFLNHIDFGTMPFSYAALSVGGKEVFDDGNLGGSSLYSEIFSYEVLYRCELATLLKTESEVVYTNTGGKKTDLLVEIDGYKVGVSVTRAFKYPPGTPLPVADAKSLLEGKLDDILLSSANVAAGDAWTKQILHVLAYDEQHRDALYQAYAQVAPVTKADTIVIVTVTDGDDGFVYSN